MTSGINLSYLCWVPAVRLSKYLCRQLQCWRFPEFPISSFHYGLPSHAGNFLSCASAKRVCQQWSPIFSPSKLNDFMSLHLYSHGFVIFTIICNIVPSPPHLQNYQIIQLIGLLWPEYVKCPKSTEIKRRLSSQGFVDYFGAKSFVNKIELVRFCLRSCLATMICQHSLGLLDLKFLDFWFLHVDTCPLFICDCLLRYLWLFNWSHQFQNPIFMYEVVTDHNREWSHASISNFTGISETRIPPSISSSKIDKSIVICWTVSSTIAKETRHCSLHKFASCLQLSIFKQSGWYFPCWRSVLRFLFGSFVLKIEEQSPGKKKPKHTTSSSQRASGYITSSYSH